jgi:aspartyl-tRNA(Asn)/glutamyl-tRNA(Gln) amidotransferase subunit A
VRERGRNVNDELTWQSASELARMIREGEVSPVEVLQAHLDRIDLAEPVLHSFITVAGEEALTQARAAERAVARKEPLGLLHGVPVAVKDEAWTKEIVSTGGSLVFGRFMPQRDGTVSERLKAAGAIIVGKNNLPEFASWPRSKNRLVRESVNPWDTSRISGASSGGSAACVAAGLVPAAVGSDGGGPSGSRPRCAVCSGYIRQPAGCRAMAASATAMPGALARSLVRWSPDFGHIAVQADVALVPDQAVSTLSQLGAKVETVGRRLGHPWGDATAMAEFQAAVAARDWDSLMTQPEHLPQVGAEEIWMWSAFAGTTPVTATTSFRDFCSHHLDLLAPYSQLSYGTAPGPADPEADRRRAELVSEMQQIFEHFDVVCSPTMPVVAPVAPAGWATPYDDPFMGTNFTFLANATGCTAASVPCGLVDGLPVGLQVIGPPGDEPTVLSLRLNLGDPTRGRPLRG